MQHYFDITIYSSSWSWYLLHSSSISQWIWHWNYHLRRPVHRRYRCTRWWPKRLRTQLWYSAGTRRRLWRRYENRATSNDRFLRMFQERGYTRHWCVRRWIRAGCTNTNILRRRGSADPSRWARMWYCTFIIPNKLSYPVASTNGSSAKSRQHNDSRM